MCKFIYAHETPDFGSFRYPWIFLAGPSPRTDEDLNWRKEAIEKIKDIYGNEKIIWFIPLPRTGNWKDVDYDEQVEWELKYLKASDVVAFWIPRTETLPGFTTNIEFGMFLYKAVYGRPPNAYKTKYLDKIYRKTPNKSIWGVLLEARGLAKLKYKRGMF